MIIALISGSIYAYYAIAYKITPTPTAATYDPYGSYQNCSEEDSPNWAGNSWGRMMGPGMRPTVSATSTPQNANVVQSSVVPLAGLVI